MGVVGVIPGTVSRRFVRGDRNGVGRKRLQVDHRPVLVVLHGRVWRLVEGRRHVKVRALEDDVVPGIGGSPLLDEVALGAVVLFVPSGREPEAEGPKPGCFGQLLEGLRHVPVDRVEHPRPPRRLKVGIEDVSPRREGLVGDRLDALCVRTLIPVPVDLESGCPTRPVVAQRAHDRVGMVEGACLKEVRLRGRAVDVDPVGDQIMHLVEELEFIDELPVPTQPRVGLFAQVPGLLVGEVGLGVYEPDGAP